MKLKNLNPGDKFKSDSGIFFQVMPMSGHEKKMHPGRIKCKRIDTGENYYLTDMIIRKN